MNGECPDCKRTKEVMGLTRASKWHRWSLRSTSQEDVPKQILMPPPPYPGRCITTIELREQWVNKEDI